MHSQSYSRETELVHWFLQGRVPSNLVGAGGGVDIEDVSKLSASDHPLLGKLFETGKLRPYARFFS